MSLCNFCTNNKPGDEDDCQFKTLLNLYAGSIGIEASVHECKNFEEDPYMVAMLGAPDSDSSEE